MTIALSLYSNNCSNFSAAVLSELFRKWVYMSVVVLVLACPALPETVTSGTPAAICIVIFVCRSECTVRCGRPASSQILCTQLSMVPGYRRLPYSATNKRPTPCQRSPMSY